MLPTSHLMTDMVVFPTYTTGSVYGAYFIKFVVTAGMIMPRGSLRALLIDCLGTVRGSRPATLDVIGAGPRAVAGVLEELGCEVVLTTPDGARKAVREGPDLLLLSAMTTDLPAAWRLARMWCRRGPGGPILIGGPACSDPIRA
ncbi:hypothetical protein DRO32_01785, partial [Candidatus Bathyarchaeota archaeon]